MNSNGTLLSFAFPFVYFFTSLPLLSLGQDAGISEKECRTYEVIYDSLDSFIDNVRIKSKELNLSFPEYLGRRELKELFVKDTIGKRKLNTEEFREIFHQKGIASGQAIPLPEDLTGSQLQSTVSLPAYPSLKYIPVQFILYADNNGNFPVTEAEVRDAIGAANDNFRRNYVSIRFFLDCPVYYSTCANCWNNPNDVTVGAMFLSHYGSHFSVHVIHNGGAQGSLPWTPLSGSVVIDDQALANGTTLTHEFGHNLGLYHTHRGRDFWQEVPFWGFFFSEIDNHDSGNCYQESVSRTKTQGIGCIGTVGQRKCDVNGDELCDTPASPDLGVPGRFNFPLCDYVWTGKDNWNKPWVPHERNYMGYTGYCRNDFTSGQIGRMISYVPAYSSSSAGYSINYNTPTNSNVICPGNTIDLSIPSSISGSLFAWHIPPGWTVTTSGLNVQPEEEGWMIYSGPSARNITLKAPSTLLQSQTYWIGVNPHGCDVKPADIQIHVGKLQLVSPYAQYCTDSEYTMESSLDATYSFSNYTWNVISGQGTTLPLIKVGTGSTTFTAKYYCGGSGRFTYYQTATLNLTATSGCSGGPPLLLSPPKLVNSVYPNPSDGESIVVLNNKQNVRVTLFHLARGVLDVSEFDIDKFEVLLPDEPGLYFVSIEGENSKETIKIYRN